MSNAKPLEVTNGFKRIATYARQNAPKGYKVQRLTPKQIRRANKKFRKVHGGCPF